MAEGFGTMFLVLMACGSAVLAGPKIGVLGIGLCFRIGADMSVLLYRQHIRMPRQSGRFVRHVSFRQTVGARSVRLRGGSAHRRGCWSHFLYWFVNMDMGFDFGGVTKSSNILASNVLQPGATSGMALLMEILFTFFFVLTILGH